MISPEILPPNRAPDKFSYESNVWLPQPGENDRVIKVSNREIGLDDLDILDFLDAISVNTHPNIYPVEAHAGEMGTSLSERYLYTSFPTLDRLKHTIKEGLESNDIKQQQVVDFAAQLADAAGHIHQLGFVHRDIRPRNIFVRSENERLKPFLADFGLVTRPFFLDKPRDSFNEETPPEIREGSTMVDARYDVYQIGWMLRFLTHDYSHGYGQWLAIKPVEQALEEIIGCATGPIVQRYTNGEVLADELRNYLDLVA